MIALRTLMVLAVLCIAGAASAADDCAAGGGLEFVCGPKNAEDLVLVPGTKWIISSGMQAGAAFYLIDSRDGKWSAVQPQAKHDAAGPCEVEHARSEPARRQRRPVDALRGRPRAPRGD